MRQAALYIVVLLALVPVVAAERSEVKLYLVDGDGESDTGPAYLNALAGDWEGDAWASSSSDPCSEAADWRVELSVDTWPLPTSNNYDHLHGRLQYYNVTMAGRPVVDWAVRNPSVPSVDMYFAAELVALYDDPDDPFEPIRAATLASGRSDEQPPAIEMRASFPLELQEPVMPEGSWLALEVSLRTSSPLCMLPAGVASMRAVPFSDAETRSGVTVAAENPLVLASVGGSGTHPSFVVYAAFGQGQLDVPGGTEVYVDGARVNGSWSFDGDVHEDFHARFNGHRYWHFEHAPPEDAALQFVFRTADGAERVFDWPLRDMSIHVDCPDADAGCVVGPDTVVDEESPGPAVVMVLAALAVALLRRR